MANSNDTIKSLLGTQQGAQAASPIKNNPALKNIATNGALLNQNLSALIQKVNAVTKAWGVNS